jgi:hypothetical protein
LAAERLHGPAERLAVLCIAQSWLTLANRAARVIDFVPDHSSSASTEDAPVAGSRPPPAIPL